MEKIAMRYALNGCSDLHGTVEKKLNSFSNLIRSQTLSISGPVSCGPKQKLLDSPEFGDIQTMPGHSRLIA